MIPVEVNKMRNSDDDVFKSLPMYVTTRKGHNKPRIKIVGCERI